MASGWFFGRDIPYLTVRPENWSTPAKRKYPGGKGTEGVKISQGVTKVELKESPNKITFDGDWYISNNLPYSWCVAFDPVYAKGAAGVAFTS